MTAHTPGPWRIGDAGHTVFGPPNGEPSPRTVCRIVNDPLRPAGESGANAALITAAPDLLAALKEYMAWHLRVAENRDIHGTPQWHMAEAAIAKAEGP